ncbi:MAG: PEP-CTERM sorting domain-containing protein [Gemmataceae bacterium]
MATAVAACLPATSLAEPITFGYTVAMATQQISVNAPGPLTMTFDPATGSVAAGSGRSVIGSVSFGNLFDHSNDTRARGGYKATAEFTVQVTVSDPASGQSGLLLVNGRAVDEYLFSIDDWVFHGRELWWQSDHSLYINGEVRGELQYLTGAEIGGGSFRLYAERPIIGYFNTAALYDYSTVVFSLEANSLAVAKPTPEPGTLSLAALGVVSTLVLRLRQRKEEARRGNLALS